MPTLTGHSGQGRFVLRWLVRALSALALLTVLALLFLPWLLTCRPVEQWLTARASRVLAPGAVHFEHLQASWTQPTEISHLTLRDAQGRDIVVAPRAQLSWSLGHILLGAYGSATLKLAGASVDIERSASGSVNLLETLRPILGDDPKRTILVRVANGKLCVRQEGLAEPFLADPANIELDLNAYPQPIAWRMSLEHSAQESHAGNLQIEGTLGRHREGNSTPPDLGLSIRGERWPWRYCSTEIDVQGTFAGTVDVHQTDGDLTLLGDTKLLDLQATGRALAGDHARLDRISVVCSVKQHVNTWTAQRLEATSSLGSFKAAGTFPPVQGSDGHLEASLDLAALTQQLPRTLHLHDELRVDKGALELRAQIGSNPQTGGQTIQATANVRSLAARRGNQSLVLRDPATFTFQLERQTNALSLEQFEVQAPFLTASGHGDLDRGIKITAMVNLSAATERLRDWVDLGPINLMGEGKVNAHYQRASNTFELAADATFVGPGATGLPVVEAVHRDHITSQLVLRGAATALGLPARLDDLSLTGQADTEQLSIRARRQSSTNIIMADGHGTAQLSIRGKKEVATGVLEVRWAGDEVTLDPIVLSLAPFVGPAGQFLPSDASRWSGRGKYDAARGELSITADSGGPTAGFQELPIAPTQIRLGGLKSRDDAWFEVSLGAELANLDLQGVDLQNRNLQGVDRQDRMSQHPGSRWDGPKLRLAGQLQSVVQARQHKEGWKFGTRAEVHNLAHLAADGKPQVLMESASASVKGELSWTLNQLELAEIAAETPYGHLQGAGPVANLLGTPTVDIHGTLSPDWKVLTDLLASKVEPKASVRGMPSTWSITGTLPQLRDKGADPLATLNGELGLTLEQVDIFGMRLGRTPLVLRSEQGRIKIDPIDSTLNSGRLHLEPAIVTDAQSQAWLHLGPSSGLLDAVVNDEVSHRVLSFAAPVLDQATRVRGRVSVALGDAFLPLSAGPDAQAKIDGDLLFDAVEFMPGPLAEQILSVFRQEHRPLLVLRDPVSVRIVGRKVYQEGLVIPLGNIAAIGLEGWIDFDQNLNLEASFAMLPPRRNIPVLSALLENTQIRVPITGTFQKPRLNGEAIKENFKELGVNVLDNLIGAGMGGLGRILQGGQGRNRPEGDLFPPFVAPDDGWAPAAPPPHPEANSPKETHPPNGLGNPRGSARKGTAGAVDRQPQQPSDSLDEDASRRSTDAGSSAVEDQRLTREERRLRRLAKRAERRMRRGLPPE
jgi:translocation and assembly module TamB